MKKIIFIAVASILLLESNVFAYTREYKIEGYSDKISYTQGDSAYFSVSLGVGYENDTLSFDYEVFRFGASTVLYTSGSDNAYHQDLNLQAPYNNDWDTTFVIEISRSWPSGVYGARISLTDTFYSYVPFIVKEDTAAVSSNILFQTTSTTWQAYNYYGGGSFYSNTCGSYMRNSISYDRPFSSALGMYGHPYNGDCDDGYSCVYTPWDASCHSGMVDSIGMTRFFHFEYYMIHWLESNGYVLEYCDNTDIDKWYDGPDNKLLNYQLFISCGHDEYWSVKMRKNVEKIFRDSVSTITDPKNLAFFSANNCFRKISFPTSDRRKIEIVRHGANEFWYQNDLIGDNPGPEERMMGSRTVCDSGYFTLADGPVTKNIDPPNPNPLPSDPRYWIYEDVMWQGQNTFGRGREFPDRRQTNQTPSGYDSEGFIGLAGFEVQARDDVIEQGSYPFKIPEGLSDIDDITVLADYTDYVSGYYNTSQMTYFSVPDSGFDKKYEVFSSGGIQWSWGLLEGDEADPGGRTPKITRNIINELARIRPTDDVSSNTVWRTNVDITTTIEVDAGVTLTIRPGVKVRFDPDGELIIRGTLIAEGSEEDSIKFIARLDDPGPGDWAGLHFMANSIGSLEYCAIRDAITGIEMEDTSSVKATNCLIKGNQYAGIDNYKGYLKLTSSYLSANGVYGLYGVNAVDTVRYTTFYQDDTYGIRISGSTSSNEDSYLLGNTITNYTGEEGSEYGIYVSGNDYVTIDSCTVKCYDQGGIRLSSSDPAINYCILADNGIYGLYCVSSSPVVRECLFESLNVGVYNFMMGTGIADLGKNIEGEYGYNSILDCSTWLIYFAGFSQFQQFYTLYAQKNWWGDANGPNPSKIYDNRYFKVNYTPWLEEDPGAKLASQLPLQFSLNQNYPNPFNANTVISFSLEKPEKTVVTVYNILGQIVATPVSEYLTAGNHSVIWDGKTSSGSSVASGVYFYTIQSGDYFDSNKMLLLR